MPKYPARNVFLSYCFCCFYCSLWAKRPFNFFYISPAGAIRGDKNIAHSPFQGVAGQGCGGPVRPPAAVLSGRFFTLSGQVGPWGHAVLPPILWGAGRLQEKSGSGQKSWLRARQHCLAGSGILSLDRPCFGRGVRAGKTLAEAVWAAIRAELP